MESKEPDRTGGPVDRRVARRGRWRAGRWRLVVIAAVAVALVSFPSVSLGRALVAPTGDPLGAKAAEWARDHGLSFLITAAEEAAYRLNPPRTGGTPDPSLLAPPTDTGSTDTRSAGTTPRTGRPTPGRGASPALPPRSALRTLVQPALPGEGVFRTLERVNGQPAVQIAYLRPDSVHTSYLAAVTVFDQRLVRFVQHPGVLEPGHLGLFRQPDSLPPSARAGLLATFNNGFKLRDSHGGYYADHHTVGALRSGGASLVIDRSGTLAIGRWGSELRMSPAVASVRQNLQLLVDHGQVTADVAGNHQSVWGLTLKGADYIWRSGIGVDARGDVIEVAGPVLSAPTLARLLVRAGAVRAMELDINPAWVSTMWYTNNGTTPHKVLPFRRPADRYFSPSSRDFVAAYIR